MTAVEKYILVVREEGLNESGSEVSSMKETEEKNEGLIIDA
jgi:hypothetical protein